MNINNIYVYINEGIKLWREWFAVHGTWAKSTHSFLILWPPFDIQPSFISVDDFRVWLIFSYFLYPSRKRFPPGNQICSFVYHWFSLWRFFYLKPSIFKTKLNVVIEYRKWISSLNLLSNFFNEKCSFLALYPWTIRLMTLKSNSSNLLHSSFLFFAFF